MKNFKVTVTGEKDSISYEVFKTLKGAKGFAKKLAIEAFFGEAVSIKVEEIK